MFNDLSDEQLTATRDAADNELRDRAKAAEARRPVTDLADIKPGASKETLAAAREDINRLLRKGW